MGEIGIKPLVFLNNVCYNLYIDSDKKTAPVLPQLKRAGQRKEGESIMAVHQRFIKRGTRSNPTAKRLIATSQNPAPHVLRSTIEDNNLHQPVMRCLAEQTAILAGVLILAGEHFYLVESEKFHGRFYVVKRHHRTGAWMCSSESALAVCMPLIKNYVRVLKANKKLQEVA